MISFFPGGLEGHPPEIMMSAEASSTSLLQVTDSFIPLQQSRKRGREVERERELERERDRVTPLRMRD